MKRIVLIVVGALVAIAMIPIIVVSINRITQEKVNETIIEFNLVTSDNETSVTNITLEQSTFVYNNYEYITSIETDNPTPLIWSESSGGGGHPALENYTYNYLGVDSLYVVLIDDNYSNPYNNPRIVFGDTMIGPILASLDRVGDRYITNYNDVKITLTFEVTTPAQVTGVGAALLNLVPILFVVGTVFSLVIFTKEWN